MDTCHVNFGIFLEMEEKMDLLERLKKANEQKISSVTKKLDKELVPPSCLLVKSKKIKMGPLDRYHFWMKQEKLEKRDKPSRTDQKGNEIRKLLERKGE